MARPTPKSQSSFRPGTRTSAGRPSQRTPTRPDDPVEPVDPIWLLKAIGGTLFAALICGYLTLCLLFYQGQWQLVLHPSRSTSAPASIGGVPFQILRFGIDESASPQLAGWFLPAPENGRYAAYTLLYLPSGDGSLADAAPTLATLHETGINVFAFDYRGYGQSAAARPNRERMAEDAASAWKYLTVSRALAPSRIVPFGDGVGAALAAQLAATHPEAPAVVLQNPRPALIQTVLADPRTKLLPVRLLFHEDFALSAAVSVLKTPKLFLLRAPSTAAPVDPSATATEIDRLTSAAATPKIVSLLSPADSNGPVYKQQLQRFFDQYLR